MAAIFQVFPALTTVSEVHIFRAAVPPEPAIS
jgi:hypothetical protein